MATPLSGTPPTLFFTAAYPSSTEATRPSMQTHTVIISHSQIEALTYCHDCLFDHVIAQSFHMILPSSPEGCLYLQVFWFDARLFFQAIFLFLTVVFLAVHFFWLFFLLFLFPVLLCLLAWHLQILQLPFPGALSLPV